MWSRRALGMSIGAVACSSSLPAGSVSAQSLELSAIPLSVHEEAMRLAIAAARSNLFFPFGAVIVRAADREVLATGANNGAANPILHGEIAAINDYVARHGNRGWGEVILYTTGEPCPMCMSALVWARIGGVVYGTSIEKLQQVGIAQILLPATTVIAAAPFYRGQILGHVLESETDALFVNRQRL
jgi:tRNA(adenine34) deaminase